jgi:hypothetical protein
VKELRDEVEVFAEEVEKKNQVFEVLVHNDLHSDEKSLYNCYTTIVLQNIMYCDNRLLNEGYVMEDLKVLLDIAGERPYYGPDYSVKRRRLTAKLKEILTKYCGRTVVDALTSRRGFKPSDQLLRYSSETFKDVLNGMITLCRSVAGLDEGRERELVEGILKAVIEVKNDP